MYENHYGVLKGKSFSSLKLLKIILNFKNDKAFKNLVNSPSTCYYSNRVEVAADFSKTLWEVELLGPS